MAAIVNSPGHRLDRHIALVLNYRPPVDKVRRSVFPDEKLINERNPSLRSCEFVFDETNVRCVSCSMCWSCLPAYWTLARLQRWPQLANSRKRQA